MAQRKPKDPFPSKPAFVPVDPTKRRKFIIWNKTLNKRVRTGGMTLNEALGDLGWLDDDCSAVDMGPPGKTKTIVEYEPNSRESEKEVV